MEKLMTEIIEHDDDVYTLDQWITQVEFGALVDYDGFGVYATSTHKMEYDPSTCVKPSMVKEGKIDKTQTHIVWYNR